MAGTYISGPATDERHINGSARDSRHIPGSARDSRYIPGSAEIAGTYLDLAETAGTYLDLDGGAAVQSPDAHVMELALVEDPLRVHHVPALEAEVEHHPNVTCTTHGAGPRRIL